MLSFVLQTVQFINSTGYYRIIDYKMPHAVVVFAVECLHILFVIILRVCFSVFFISFSILSNLLLLFLFKYSDFVRGFSSLYTFDYIIIL